MTSINTLFRTRIGFPENERITFEKLDTILERAGKTIPFENLRIINNQSKAITKENLTEKILLNNEGGLCYELNTIFHHFLIENGFNVELARGRTFNFASNSWSQAGQTHILNLLSYNGQKYIIDSGFGGNLPLKPVPLSGATVTSTNGEFRTRQITSEDGDYLFELKLKHRDQDWVNGYIFHSTKKTTEEVDSNEVQQIIIESPFSPFNKSPLLTRLTDSGNIILTDKSLTERTNGQEQKTEINSENFKQLTKQHFGFEA